MSRATAFASSLNISNLGGKEAKGDSLNVQSPLSTNSDDSRVAESCLLIKVLVSVDEQPRSCALDVANERLETKMNIIVAVVDVPWRVVGDKDIDGRKGRQQMLDLWLLVKVVAAWLIAPRGSRRSARHQWWI